MKKSHLGSCPLGSPIHVCIHAHISSRSFDSVMQRLIAHAEAVIARFLPQYEASQRLVEEAWAAENLAKENLDNMLAVVGLIKARCLAVGALRDSTEALLDGNVCSGST